MRKFMVIPMVGILALALAGPVAAGPNVSNTSGGGESIYGEWYGEGSYGYVMVGEESGYGGFGDIYQEAGEWVPCEPPADATPGKKGAVAQDTTPGDEFYGFVGTRSYGYAYDVQIDISRRFETGHATGSVELYTETIDECNGIYGGDAVAEIGSLDVTVTGVGLLASFRGTGTYKIPSEFNGHENYRGKERLATGSVVAGSAIDATFSFGSMTQLTWTLHIND